MSQNSKCRLYGYTINAIMMNRIISDCSKQVQKQYETRHDWVGKLIGWELCKKFKLARMNKWYLHKPESILENEINKTPCVIQTDHLISARRQVLMATSKKKRIC